jgi:hypothetical protein
VEPDDRYWAVDLPGLTEEGAAVILSAARRLNLTGPSALNPKTFLTLALDRETVMTLASTLRDAEDLDDQARSLLEEFDAWLAYSDTSSR